MFIKSFNMSFKYFSLIKFTGIKNNVLMPKNWNEKTKLTLSGIGCLITSVVTFTTLILENESQRSYYKKL